MLGPVRRLVKLTQGVVCLLLGLRLDELVGWDWSIVVAPFLFIGLAASCLSLFLGVGLAKIACDRTRHPRALLWVWLWSLLLYVGFSSLFLHRALISFYTADNSNYLIVWSYFTIGLSLFLGLTTLAARSEIE